MYGLDEMQVDERQWQLPDINEILPLEDKQDLVYFSALLWQSSASTRQKHSLSILHESFVLA